jgi:hypothetical protein
MTAALEETPPPLHDTESHATVWTLQVPPWQLAWVRPAPAQSWYTHESDVPPQLEPLAGGASGQVAVGAHLLLRTQP